MRTGNVTMNGKSHFRRFGGRDARDGASVTVKEIVLVAGGSVGPAENTTAPRGGLFPTTFCAADSMGDCLFWLGWVIVAPGAPATATSRCPRPRRWRR